MTTRRTSTFENKQTPTKNLPAWYRIFSRWLARGAIVAPCSRGNFLSAESLAATALPLWFRGRRDLEKDGHHISTGGVGQALSGSDVSGFSWPVDVFGIGPDILALKAPEYPGAHRNSLDFDAPPVRFRPCFTTTSTFRGNAVFRTSPLVHRRGCCRTMLPCVPTLRRVSAVRDVDDVVQESYLRIWRRARRADWLRPRLSFTIVRNIAPGVWAGSASRARFRGFGRSIVAEGTMRIAARNRRSCC